MDAILNDKRATARIENDSRQNYGDDKRYVRKVRRKVTNKINYVLGHSEREIRRLQNQANILRPITKRLLRNSGICEGMRVLDVGCGAGDVSLWPPS
jgi:2-polyprenyl-3-methyl-5-hydroxy-6-metoxy-1,4-benzoquinol methylase